MLIDVLAATFLIAGAAGVDASADFQDGVRLYESVQLEEAEQHFNAALAGASDDAERARVQAWIGLVHAQLGDQAGAKAAFEKAVKLDPHVVMPAAAAAEVTALLESARAASVAAAPTTTTLPEAPPPTAPADKGVPWLAVGVGGTGAVLVGVGGLTFALGMQTALVDAPKAEFNDDARSLVSTGYTEYAVGGALAAVGVAGVVGGAVLFAVE